MAFPGQTSGYRAPKFTNPFQGIVDWATKFTGPSANYDTSRPDRMWQPGVRNFPSGYKEAELAAGRAAEAFRPGAGFPGQSTPIVLGTRDGVTPDRTQSDLYKQYALNPQGQFDRYFGGGEMDQYFGAASRGKGAPQDLAAMNALAGQAKATGDLATYYRAQSAAGRGNMPEIVEGLTYGLDPKKAAAMKQWAETNPMLAMREFNKKFPSGQPTMGSGEPVTAESLQGTQYQGVGGQGFDTSALTGDPITKAFTLPGGAMTQGQAVSQPYADANALAALKTNPQNAISQMPVGDRTKEFLGALGVFPGMKGKGAFGS
jgi:hypothetical protein